MTALQEVCAPGTKPRARSPPRERCAEASLVLAPFLPLPPPPGTRGNRWNIQTAEPQGWGSFMTRRLELVIWDQNFVHNIIIKAAVSHGPGRPNPLVNNGSERPHPEPGTALTLSSQVRWGGFEFRNTLRKEETGRYGSRPGDLGSPEDLGVPRQGSGPTQRGQERQPSGGHRGWLWVPFPLRITLGDARGAERPCGAP